MYAIHRQAAPPSGVAYSLSARLTPSCLQSTSSSKSKIVRNLVTARDDFLQLFEVVEEANGSDASAPALRPHAHANGVVYDQTDGEDDIAEELEEKKPAAGNGDMQNGTQEESTTTSARLRFVREYSLHGAITGLQRIQTVDTARDGLDRLLVSFKNAKASLLEWSSEQYDLVTASLHTFEKLPHLIQGDLTGYTSLLRVDPLSRCAGLLLPQDAMAITPFFQDQIELEGAEEGMASLPYAPSSVVELTDISPQLRHVKDFVFLAGFNEPTLAILTQPEQTWTGRLENAKDVTQLFLLTIDVTSTPPSSTIISQTSSLPYDCLHLTACPRDLGGVVITTNNALIHVDQAGKCTGAALNPWANLVSDVLKLEQISEEPLPLEHSSLMFITSDVALLFLQDGRIRAIKVQRDGRTISKIVLLPDELESTVPPSSIELIRSHLSPKGADGSTQACYAFVGSLLADNQILKIDFRTILDESMLESLQSEKLEAEDNLMIPVDEDDIDIYGSAEAKAAVLDEAQNSRVAASSRFVVSTKRCFTIPSHGPIRSATMGLIEAEGPSDLVACTGDGTSGGLTVLHRSVLPSRRSRMELDHSTESIWIIEVRTEEAGSKTYMLTASEGETQVYTLERLELEHPEYVKTFAKTTLSASTFRNATSVLYLLRDAIVIVDANFREVQRLALPKDARILSATIAGSFVLIEREEAASLLFQDKAGTLDSITLPEQALHRTSLFQDKSASFPLLNRSRLRSKRSELHKSQGSTNGKDSAEGYNDDDIYGEQEPVTVPAVAKDIEDSDMLVEQDVAADEAVEAWLCSCSEQGILTPVFVSGDILTQPPVIEDTQQDQCFEDLPEDVSIESIHIVSMGRKHRKPHLLLLLEDGSLIVYEAFEDFGYASRRSGTSNTLALRWLKVDAQALGASKRSRTADEGNTLGPAARHFIPFTGLDGYVGIFVTGENPVWLLKDDIGPFRVFESSLKPVFGFTTYQAQIVISLGEDIVIGELPEDTCFARTLPFTKVVRGRLYTDIAYHSEGACYAAISSFPAPFEIFQDEGEPLHPYDAEQALQPTAPRTALEIIEPGSWISVDGYEFRQYETALSVAVVKLETESTESKLKEYLAVGTIISRGEDLASRGALYVFEIVSTQGTRKETTPRRSLRLLFTEDLKAPLANVSALNCYLLHSVGLKIYAKAFDQDERLLAIGFLDVGVHTTCIRALKNLILVGDTINGLQFIAFQEDPYKFIALGKEVVSTPVVTADFLVSEGKAQLVSSDMYGNVRLFEYDPLRAETQGGQRLLPRIEFHAGAEAACSIPFAKSSTDDPKQSGILYLHINGSLSTVVPVRDAVYKRLQLLERQVIRHTHHFAGLNPRAHRTVHNAYVPRPLTKGLLDGDLLSTYSMLSTIRQQQLADPLGSDSDTLNYNIRSLKAPW